MNFLNKKYTSLHGTAPYQHSNSRTFLAASSSAIRDSPPGFTSNNCETHQTQIVRHMCLQCVQLLCAECIGQHLQLHRQANLIPKIMSIRQLRSQMQLKIDHIVNVMQSQNPSALDLDGLRKNVLERIDAMRKDLVRAIDDWVGILRNHLIGTLGFEEVGRAKGQMERLREEVGLLQQSLSGAGLPSVVKKIMQIDAEKLKESYNGTFLKYRELQQRTDFQIVLNWKEIIQAIETNIVMKPRNEQEQSEEEQGQGHSRSQSAHSITSDKSGAVQGKVLSREQLNFQKD